MNLFQRDNHMVTYSTFRSNRSIDFVFRFPPCSYSSMIPKNKHCEFCFRISLNKQDICKPILNSAVIPQLWCMKLKKNNIWQEVEIKFVKNVSHHMACQCKECLDFKHLRQMFAEKYWRKFVRQSRLKILNKIVI